MGSDDRRIFHGILSGFGLTFVTIVVAFVQLRLVLEFLPKPIAGVWLLFLSLGAYVAFFDLGISPTLSREISFILGRDAADAESRKRIADLLATCFRTFQIIAALVFVAGLAGGGVFLSGVAPAASVRAVWLAWTIFLLGASLNIIGGAAYAALYGLGDVATERSARAFTQLLGLAMSYVALALGFGLIGMALAWVIQNLLARGIALHVLHKKHPWLRHEQGKAVLATFKRLAGPSLRWAATGLGAILILQTDNVIIAAVLGPNDIPSYEAIAKIAMTLMTLSLYIVTSSSPFVSKAFAAGDFAAMNGLVLRNVRCSMGAMVFLAAFMAAFGDHVIDLWLGSGNFVGFAVTWTLLAMVLLETHHVSLATATMATGRIAFAWAALGAGLLNITITLVLVHYWGLWGVALGTLIAQLLTNNWYAPYVSLRHFNIAFQTYARIVLLPIIIMLLVAGGLAFGLRTITQGYASYLALPAALVLYTALSAIAFNFLILNSGEREVLAASLKQHTWLRK